MKKVSIVIGAGFGDEGKGLVTSYLVSQSAIQPLVIRFNGGHQAGHTVVLPDGTRHVFSSFGSGTLQGAPTFISKYCTIYPRAILNELAVLSAVPKLNYINLFIDPHAMVTTPFDVMANQADAAHGSVGVGFGKTIARNERFYHLFFQDLFHDGIFEAKMKNIYEAYYDFSTPLEIDPRWIEFKKEVERLRECAHVRMASFKTCAQRTSHLIFEGAQGIMLDQHFGFFPNVTRSNTTSQNAMEMVKSLGKEVEGTVYYVTRAYQTRHGNGYMTDEREIELVNNEQETNVEHKYQGKFRKGILDLDLIRHAIGCDVHVPETFTQAVVMTCLDQVPETFKAINKGKELELTQNPIHLNLLMQCGLFNKMYVSNGPSYDKITQLGIERGI